MWKKLKQAAAKLIGWWKDLGKPVPVVVLLVLIGCAPATSGGLGDVGALSMRELPPGQLARSAQVEVRRLAVVTPMEAARQVPDTQVLAASWSVAQSVDSIQVTVVGWADSQAPTRRVTTYRRTGSGIPQQHTEWRLLPEGVSQVDGVAWVCVVAFRGEQMGGTVYPDQHVMGDPTLPNCSPKVAYDYRWEAPMASGVTLTVERRP